MAKKKLEIDLRPIRAQIKQIQAEMRGLKPRASAAAQTKIARDSKRLDGVIKQLTSICKGRMTLPFDPADSEE